MTMSSLAVTGSTGAVGGLVARHLAALDIPQRLLVRTPAKAPQLPGTTVHQSDYSDHAATRAALMGVTTVFMVSAPESVERRNQHRSFVDAAADAGVQHIVYTSFAAAAPDAIFTLARDHYDTEEYIKSSGMSWTFLRDGFYLELLEEIVGDDRVIRGPAGNGRAAFVARADVARTAAVVLADPGPHRDMTYNLTGPEALSLDEAAATLSAVQGTPVTFHDESLEEAYASRAVFEAPDWEVDAWVSTYTAIASNVMAGISTDIETITGTAPMSFETYLRSKTA